jgi:hypothetical protein
VKNKVWQLSRKQNLHKRTYDCIAQEGTDPLKIEFDLLLNKPQTESEYPLQNSHVSSKYSST